MNVIEFGNYKLVRMFREITPDFEREIVAFWEQNRALSSSEEAFRRAREVYSVARAPDGSIAAVCTVYVADFGTPPAPHYHYRMFIRPADRKNGLAVAMTSTTRKELMAAYTPGDAVVGLVIVAENPLLMNPAVREHFKRGGWEFQGSDPRGCDIWRRRFDTAR